MDYEAICRSFPWSLAEVKDMPKRERDYWFRVSQEVRKERNQIDVMKIRGAGAAR